MIAVSDDTPWLTRDEIRTWVHLTGLMMSLPPAIDGQLKRDSCVNFFEYQIMVSLAREPSRAVQMSVLAQLAWGSPSRLSHAISRMEKAGWVERRAANCDPRAVVAVLTDAGFAKLSEAAPGHVREVRRLVIDVLSPEQLDQLREICAVVTAAASPEAGELIERALQGFDADN
jgi:DNA-binding MarR family transcriptional regulator